MKKLFHKYIYLNHKDGSAQAFAGFGWIIAIIQLVTIYRLIQRFNEYENVYFEETVEYFIPALVSAAEIGGIDLRH